MNVRFVVPRRADGGHRDRLWAYCQTRWREAFDWPFAEGHHDDGPFNRSAAINDAAIGEWDVVVIIDADVVIDPEPVHAAVELAARTGNLVLPYTRRMLVGDKGTQAILDGYQGSWVRFAKPDSNRGHCSSVVVVPRALWDRVGSFDPRFVGWGAEDDAFLAACSQFADVERLAGDVWHLHHPPSPEKNFASPQYRMNKALLDRYQTDTERVLTEDRSDDQIAIVVITNGRRDTLAKTIHSAAQMLHGPIGRRVICDGSKGVHGAIADAHPEWEVVDTGQDPGYALAMRRAQQVAIGSGQPWIVWLEDDFTFNQPIHLAAMQMIMNEHPELAQLALLRQAWYEPELAAGGIFQAHPDRFEQRDGYVAHRAFWTSNPMLTSRSVMARHEWPLGKWSEGKFARLMLRDRELECGFLGTLDDPPRVTHIGVERAGNGY